MRQDVLGMRYVDSVPECRFYMLHDFEKLPGQQRMLSWVKEKHASGCCSCGVPQVAEDLVGRKEGICFQ